MSRPFQIPVIHTRTLCCIVVSCIIAIATTAPLARAQEEPRGLFDGPGPFVFSGCNYPDFATLELDAIYDACLPLDITEFDEDDPAQPNMGTTAAYYRDSVQRRMGEHVNFFHPSGLYSSLEEPENTRKHPACLCRPNQQKLVDIFRGSDSPISQRCVDYTVAITTKYANSYDEAPRIILPSNEDAREINSSMAYAMMAESNTYIGDQSCVDMSTAAKPFDPQQPLSMPGSPTLQSYRSSASSIQDFVEKYLFDADQATLDRMYHNAGLRPTGNIPKGCIPGYLIGHTTAILRETIATWDGKCFLANNTMWNYGTPKSGPNDWSVPGEVIPNSPSYFDDLPTTTVAYVRSDYWTRLSQLVTVLVQDPSIFHDEIREIPDMPGFFLGQVWFGNVTEDRSVTKEGFERTYQLPTGQRVPIPDIDVSDPRESPQMDMGADEERMDDDDYSVPLHSGVDDAMQEYRRLFSEMMGYDLHDPFWLQHPLFYFAVFQVDNYPAHCIQPCENFI